MCDKTIYAVDIVSTQKTNTIAKIVTSTASIDCHSKKVRYKIDCNFSQSFISDHMTIDDYYYLLSLCKTLVKTKRYWYYGNIKMENNELKNIRINNRTCYYLGDIIKLNYFHFASILIDEKSHKNILIYEISYKTLIGPNSLRYLVSLKSGTTYIFSHYYVKIKIDSYDSLPTEKISTYH